MYVHTRSQMHTYSNSSCPGQVFISKYHSPT